MLAVGAFVAVLSIKQTQTGSEDGAASAYTCFGLAPTAKMVREEGRTGEQAP